MDGPVAPLARFRPEFLALPALAALSAALHALPFIWWGQHPLGYDTGFYRRYLIEPFISFPNTPVPGLGDDALVPRLLLDTLRFTHLPADALLYGSYIAFFTALPLVAFVLLKHRLGARGAFFAASFIILSPIQYNAYWYMFWKNAWALCLLLLAFVCLDRRWYKTLFALDIAIALSHKTTAIMYIATLGMLFLINKKRRAAALAHAATTAVVALAVGTAALHSVLVAPPVAVFLEWRDYILLSVPFVLVIIAGYRGIARMGRGPVFSFVAAGFILTLLHIPFYERLFVFCDVGLAILAAYALEDVFSRIDVEELGWKSIAYIAVLCIACGLFAGALWNQVRALRPLVPQSDIRSIEEIAQMVPAEATILTTSDEAPWYEGWTRSHIAAPGMLRDNHNLDEWTAFWNATSSAERIAFLDDLPKPLYISTLGNFEDLVGILNIPCLTRISPVLLYDACDAEK